MEDYEKKENNLLVACQVIEYLEATAYGVPNRREASQRLSARQKAINVIKGARCFTRFVKEKKSS